MWVYHLVSPGKATCDTLEHSRHLEAVSIMNEGINGARRMSLSLGEIHFRIRVNYEQAVKQSYLMIRIPMNESAGATNRPRFVVGENVR